MKVNIHSNNPDYHYKFEVSETGIVGIYGVSGCGKSSLLNALAGYHDVCSGVISFNNENIFDSKVSKSTTVNKCSYMNQHPVLFPHWSVIENLKFAERYNSHVINSINYLAEVLECEDLLNKYPKQLSGGEKQRIAFIRALIQININSLVLLDEPFSAIDSKLREKALNLLADYKKDNLIFLVTHEILELYQVADELLLINNNKVTFKQNIIKAMSCGKFNLPIASKLVIENQEYVIFADDVSISLEVNPNSSITHQIQATIREIITKENYVLVTLELDKSYHKQIIHAKIRKHSLHKLNLEINKQVVVNFKSTSYQ